MKTKFKLFYLQIILPQYPYMGKRGGVSVTPFPSPKNINVHYPLLTPTSPRPTSPTPPGEPQMQVFF